MERVSKFLKKIKRSKKLDKGQYRQLLKALRGHPELAKIAERNESFAALLMTGDYSLLDFGTMVHYALHKKNAREIVAARFPNLNRLEIDLDSSYVSNIADNFKLLWKIAYSRPDPHETEKAKKILENLIRDISIEKAKNEEKMKIAEDILAKFGFPGDLKQKVLNQLRQIPIIPIYKIIPLLRKPIDPIASFVPAYNFIAMDPYDQQYKKALQEEVTHAIHFIVNKHTKVFEKQLLSVSEFLAALVKEGESTTEMKSLMSEKSVEKKQKELMEKSNEQYTEKIKKIIDVLRMIKEDLKKFDNTQNGQKVIEIIDKFEKILKDSNIYNTDQTMSDINFIEDELNKLQFDAVSPISKNVKDLSKLIKITKNLNELAFKTKRGLEKHALTSEIFADVQNRDIKRHIHYDDADWIKKAGLDSELIEKYGYKLFTMHPLRLLMIIHKYRKLAEKRLREKQA